MIVSTLFAVLKVLVILFSLLAGLELTLPSKETQEISHKLNLSASFRDTLLLIMSIGGTLFIYLAGVQSMPVAVWVAVTLFAVYFGTLWEISRTIPVTLDIQSQTLPHMTVNVQKYWRTTRCWQMVDADKEPLKWELVMPFFGLKAHFRVHLHDGTMVKVPIGQGMFVQLEDGTKMSAYRDRTVDMNLMQTA